MKKVGVLFLLIVAIVAATKYLPVYTLEQPVRSVTVVGEASNQEANQVASYNAGVNAVNDNKDAAIKEVNDKVSAMIESVKEFGVADADIKTSNLNIYQNQESYYEEGSQKQRLGQWNVSNSVEIKLRDITRASELAELLSQSGANNVWGPNFALDETAEAEDGLTEQAIENAREKAARMAEASGARLGKVLQVSEGSSAGIVTPFARMDGMGGGGIPTEPGSTTVTKMVTVTFELR
jgi:uncharacterized protein